MVVGSNARVVQSERTLVSCHSCDCAGADAAHCTWPAACLAVRPRCSAAPVATPTPAGHQASDVACLQSSAQRVRVQLCSKVSGLWCL